jgi:ubiquinone/menaquinone biosynthesis C-methylase UbiE
MDNTINNKDFWNELCGSNLFIHLELKDVSRESLKIFDDYYFNMYPYLKTYVSEDKLKNKTVLEIGLGFGTLSEYMFKTAKNYVGVDYSDNPVNMVNDRINTLGFSNSAYAVQGDARELKFEDATFDSVVSIGCLHHTGDTQKSVNEVYRVLKPGGHAILMLYNKNSFRKKIVNPYRYFLAKRKKQYKSFEEYTRASYDANTAGDAAPIVDMYSKSEVKQLLKNFSSIKIQPENFDNHFFTLFKKEYNWPREKFLNNVAKLMGLDLYIVAKK